MKHMQFKYNLDGTICLDYYEDELYTNDVVNTLRDIIGFFKSNNIDVRRYPFPVTKCKKCGHTLLTNRDYLDEIKCQNCGETFDCVPVINDMNKALLNEIHGTLGYKLQGCEGFIVYMLAFVPKGADISLLDEIMKAFGFCPERCKGRVYERLLSIARVQGWITEDCKVTFYRMVLDNNDVLFENTIPRVESCARAIKKYVDNSINSISIHLIPGEMGIEDANNADDSDNQERTVDTVRSKPEKRKQIEQLMIDGKIDEALKLLDEL